jgi:non-ribosomal peptide synthetase component F
MFEGNIQAFTVPAGVRAQVRTLCSEAGVTPFMVLLTAFSVVLLRHTGKEDIVVGTVAPGGRKHAAVQHLLGYFLNPVMLRLNLTGNPPVRHLLLQAREATAGALANDDVPLEILMTKLNPQADPTCRSVVHAVLTLAPPLAELSLGWQQTPMDADSGWARWPLYVEFSERADGLIGRAQYSTECYSAEAISQLLSEFTHVLQHMTSDSGQHIAELVRT